MFKFKHSLTIVVALLLSFVFSQLVSAFTEELTIIPERNVLVIHQYSAEHAYPDLFNQGLRESFEADARYFYNFSYEYLEIDQMPHDAVYLEKAVELFAYKMKHSNWQPDIVVASDGVSDWLLKHKDHLFGDIPIVACAPGYAGKSTIPIDYFTDHYLLPGQDSFAENYQLILDLLPDTENIYVVLGNSYEEQNLLTLAKEEAEVFKDKVTFVYMNRRNNADMLSTLRNAPPRSAVLFSRWLTDIDGESFIPSRYLTYVASTIDIPVFVTQQQFTNKGVVGGYVYDISLLGADAGTMAIELLDGVETSSFTNEERYHHYIFDERALKHWNIDSRRLPADSIVLFTEKNFWQEHGDVVVIVGVILALETGLIIDLIYSNRRRVKAEADLLLLNESLENIVEQRTLELQSANEQLEELNRRLDHTARIDPLTGLYNRRHMDERMNEELQLFRRRGQEFSIMIIDIDDFKTVNDNLGHMVGDQVLKQVADVLRENVRKYDVVSRWGGEEFLLLFPALNECDALARADA
ncbi:MAG: ABC transporter substrate binding protein, partial [Eubacteriales bacterium]|nr:ABC transporter substrate binding protein [Eubacteriales bacterium]